MLRRRLHRLCTTLSVVVALLFSQLALASYVCPGQASADDMAAEMAAGQPCDGMDADQPVLCHQHSAAASQSFEAVKLPIVSWPAIVHMRVVPLLIDARRSEALPPAATSEAWPPPDPLFLSTLRLRV